MHLLRHHFPSLVPFQDSIWWGLTSTCVLHSPSPSPTRMISYTTKNNTVAALKIVWRAAQHFTAYTHRSHHVPRNAIGRDGVKHLRLRVVQYEGSEAINIGEVSSLHVLYCYEPLERFIDIMERRQSNGGQQRHYPFRHPKWRYPYLEGPSTRPYTPTRSLLLQIHSHSNLANR